MGMSGSASLQSASECYGLIRKLHIPNAMSGIQESPIFAWFPPKRVWAGFLTLPPQRCGGTLFFCLLGEIKPSRLTDKNPQQPHNMLTTSSRTVLEQPQSHRATY